MSVLTFQPFSVLLCDLKLFNDAFMAWCPLEVINLQETFWLKEYVSHFGRYFMLIPCQKLNEKINITLMYIKCGTSVD